MISQILGFSGWIIIKQRKRLREEDRFRWEISKFNLGQMELRMYGSQSGDVLETLGYLSQ